jgi:hypothetical protein
LSAQAGTTSPVCSATSSGPPLGVYAGAASPSGVTSFESATGTKVALASDYLPGNAGFAGMSNASELSWLTDGWQGSGCQLILGVPIIPTSSGIPSGTLAGGAAGDYNSYYKTLAHTLIAAGDADVYLRLGWEFDGDWFPWSADTPATEADYATYFQQIVQTMRAVAGENFKFVWNPDAGAFTTSGYNVALAYPGNAYVNAIALDQYDQTWATPQTPDTAWSVTALPALTAAQQFASAQGEPLGLAEWGVAIRSDGHGLGDDPYFINQMKAWMDSNNVAFADYFNADQAPTQYDALTDGRFPNSLSAYRADFAPAAAAPAPGSGSGGGTTSGTGAAAPAPVTTTTTTSVARSSSGQTRPVGPDPTGLEARATHVGGIITSRMVTMSARLAASPWAEALAGQSIKFKATNGAGSCHAITDSSGVATCTITLELLTDTPSEYAAAFAGTADFQATFDVADVSDTGTPGL